MDKNVNLTVNTYNMVIMSIAHEPCVIQQLALRDTIIINAIFYQDIVIGNFHIINLR